MDVLPANFKKLVDELRKLPGVGQKSASRMAMHYMGLSNEQLSAVGQLFEDLSRGILNCEQCGILSESEECPVCGSSERDELQILVVENFLDVIAFEEIGEYKGVYHVLGGVISPVNGIGPEDLNIANLTKRISEFESREGVEIIFATNPTLEGEATVTYIAQELNNFPNIRISTLARGLPTGADLDYADASTLRQALNRRTEL